MGLMKQRTFYHPYQASRKEQDMAVDDHGSHTPQVQDVPFSPQVIYIDRNLKQH